MINANRASGRCHPARIVTPANPNTRRGMLIKARVWTATRIDISCATAGTVGHEMSILVAVHTLALMSIPLLVFGFAGVTMRAGWHRPEALLAFIIYALSAIALMLAGIADGLINAALIPQMTGASDLKLQALKAALSYNFQFNQACA